MKSVMILLMTFMAFMAVGQAGPMVSVAEYEPIISYVGPVDAVQGNVINYKKFVDVAADRGTDILVFPENGLTGTLIDGFDMAWKVAQFIPDDFQPCQEDLEDDVLNDLSCMAKKGRMYLVVNLLERVLQKYDKCKTNENKCVYNTVIAFDRDGGIVAKYQKFHLDGKNFISKPKEAKLSYFDTDVGLRVGLIIGSDLNYADPAQQLLQVPVDVVACPAAWLNELPFLTAPQYHSGWSQAFNATLLSAGHHYPPNGTLGSGIYTDHGTLSITYDPGTDLKLLSADLFEDDAIDSWAFIDPTVDGMFIHEDLSAYEMTPLPPGVLSLTLSQKDQSGSEVQCRLEYSLSTENSGLYFVARSGMRTFDNGRNQAAVQVCGLVYCPGGPPCHWDYKFKQENHFEWLRLSGTFDDKVRPMPVMMSGRLNPIIPPTMAYTGRSNEFMLKSKKEVVDLFSLGLYGRNYRLDSYRI